jgi:hypothetical protein
MFTVYFAEKNENALCGTWRATFFVINASRFIEKIRAITDGDFRSPTSPLRMLHFLLDFAFY